MKNHRSNQTVSFRKLASTKLFALGVTDYTLGKPLRAYDALEPYFTKTRRGTKAVWAYERGRLYAAFCIGRLGSVPPIKTPSGRVSWVTIANLKQAVRGGLIT